MLELERGKSRKSSHREEGKGRKDMVEERKAARAGSGV